MGRPIASVTACSLVFMPHLLRPIRRLSPLSLGVAHRSAIGSNPMEDGATMARSRDGRFAQPGAMREIAVSQRLALAPECPQDLKPACESHDKLAILSAAFQPFPPWTPFPLRAAAVTTLVTRSVGRRRKSRLSILRNSFPQCGNSEAAFLQQCPPGLKKVRSRDLLRHSFFWPALPAPTCRHLAPA